MSNTSFWKIFGWLAAVSICSAALGAVAALRLQNVQNARMARTTSVGGLAEERLEKLREILHLNPEQEQAIAALLSRREKEIRAIAAAAGEQAAHISRELEDEIRRRLDPEQARRFDRLQEIRRLQRERLRQGERPSPEQRERWRERLRSRDASPTPDSRASS